MCDEIWYDSHTGRVSSGRDVGVDVESSLNRDWQIAPRGRQQFRVCMSDSGQRRASCCNSTLVKVDEEVDLPMSAMTVAPFSSASAMISPSGLTTSECPYYRVSSYHPIRTTGALPPGSSHPGVGRASTWPQTSGCRRLCACQSATPPYTFTSRDTDDTYRARCRRCQCMGPVVVLNADG